MNIMVHSKSNAVLTDKMVQEIHRRRIFWSDDRNCHWFFDFQVDDVWISSWSINNALTECTVKLYKGG